jgi:hypothetical protein
MVVRDLLEWPEMLKSSEDDIPVIEKWDVAARVDSMLRQFCPLLGCIQSACPSHSACSVAYPTLVKLLSTAHDRKLDSNVKPTLSNDSLRLKAKHSCDNNCFTLESDEYIVRGVHRQNII